MDLHVCMDIVADGMEMHDAAHLIADAVKLVGLEHGVRVQQIVMASCDDGGDDDEEGVAPQPIPVEAGGGT